MVQRGRSDTGRFSDEFSDPRMGLYEGCGETGCARVVAGSCGFGKRYCSIHIEEHRRKDNRSKKKT